jgi:predicted ATPase
MAKISTPFHGESFIKLFQARLVPGGVTCLTNPKPHFRHCANSRFCDAESAVADNCIHLSHASPILMAFPDATILSFDQTPIAKDTFMTT